MNSTRNHSRQTWIKSSYSGNGGVNCLEWAPIHVRAGIISVRDSKETAARPITFSPAAWSAFTTELRLMAHDAR